VLAHVYPLADSKAKLKSIIDYSDLKAKYNAIAAILVLWILFSAIIEGASFISTVIEVLSLANKGYSVPLDCHDNYYKIILDSSFYGFFLFFFLAYYLQYRNFWK